MEGAGPAKTPLVSCPVCSRQLPAPGIYLHLERCLQEKGGEDQRPEVGGEDSSCPPALQQPCKKKMRLSSSPERSSREEEPGDSRSPPPVFALFQKGRSSGARTPGSGAAAASPTRGPEKPPERESPPALGTDASVPELSGKNLAQNLEGKNLAQNLEGKPLADKLRPDTLEDYMGQNRVVVGQQTFLRSLLEAHEIPSLIFWGPPGCGKTTLAHIIAKGSKKKGTRFVTLSATSAKTSDVREVISQAQNEKRLFKRKTILFVDEIHRFNKSQQDTFLPHVESGTVTLIGATTENPSLQVNSALLSRCCVIVLEKLSVEAMEAILMRALKSLGIQILNPDEQCAGSVDGSNSEISESCLCIERRAVNTLAYLCDGDARTGLNGLQIAVQAQLTQLPHQSNLHGSSTNRIVITEDHVKEGLQRSHILYDRAGEERCNCISALHKSMRDSDEKSSLHWLARMLEGGEDPLYVARRLVRFASEDIGLADPLALTQAVAAYQGCHFIGMPECEVLLAQCVIYFARAPKSIEVYSAYSNVKTCLRNHEGPLPPVPLHLRNAPTRLMSGGASPRRELPRSPVEDTGVHPHGYLPLASTEGSACIGRELTAGALEAEAASFPGDVASADLGVLPSSNSFLVPLRPCPVGVSLELGEKTPCARPALLKQVLGSSVPGGRGGCQGGVVDPRSPGSQQEQKSYFRELSEIGEEESAHADAGAHAGAAGPGLGTPPPEAESEASASGDAAHGWTTAADRVVRWSELCFSECPRLPTPFPPEPPDSRTRIWIIGHSVVHWAGVHVSSARWGVDLDLGQDVDVVWLGQCGSRWESLMPTIRDALGRLEPPQAIVIHLGENDLPEVSGLELSIRIEAGLYDIMGLLPDVKLFWSHLLPRLRWKGAKNAQKVDLARRKASKAAAKVALALCGSVISHPHFDIRMSSLFRSDGVDLSDQGIDLWLGAVRQALLEWLAFRRSS